VAERMSMLSTSGGRKLDVYEKREEPLRCTFVKAFSLARK